MVQNSHANAGDMCSIPGLGRSLGGRNGNPLQYSCLGNPIDRGTWQVTLQGVMKVLDTTQQLNNNKAVDVQQRIRILNKLKWLQLFSPHDYSLA